MKTLTITWSVAPGIRQMRALTILGVRALEDHLFGVDPEEAITTLTTTLQGTDAQIKAFQDGIMQYMWPSFDAEIEDELLESVGGIENWTSLIEQAKSIISAMTVTP